MTRILEKLKKEIIDAIPAIIYFIITFNFVHFISLLSKEPGDERYYNYLNVTLFALVAGKVLIIMNAFSFVNLFPNKPLIYNIIWKTFLYSLFMFLFRVLDVTVRLTYHFDNAALVWQQLVITVTSHLFFAIQLCLAFLFFGYIIFSEITRVIGKDKMSTMIFGRKVF